MSFIEIAKDLHQDAFKQTLMNSIALSLHLRERERGGGRCSVYDLRNDEETAPTVRRPESHRASSHKSVQASLSASRGPLGKSFDSSP